MRIACKLLWASLFANMSIVGVHAQDAPLRRTSDDTTTTDDTPYAPLLRPSRLSVGWPRDFFYEGDVRVPVFLWSRTHAIRHISDQEYERRSSGCWPFKWPNRSNAPVLRVNKLGADPRVATGCTLAFVPRFVIRQESDGSAAVSTPTFNPHLQFTWFDFALEQAQLYRERQARAPQAQRRAQLLALHLNVGHYSNGQSGCLLTTQVRDATDACRGSGTYGDLNTNDGSFSTNHVDFGGTAARMWYSPSGVERLRRSVNLQYRWNVPYGPGGLQPDLAALYGRHTLFGLIEQRHYFRYVTATVTAQGERAMRNANNVRVDGTASLTLNSLFGFGVFARWAHGFDDYNIAFGQRVVRPHAATPAGFGGLIFGIAFDHARPTTISAAAAKLLQARSEIR